MTDHDEYGKSVESERHFNEIPSGFAFRTTIADTAKVPV
jgi:hypothetical protein